MVQNARGIDDVKGSGAQAWALQIGLHELHIVHAEAPGGRRAQLQRGACQIGADHHPVGAPQIQAHLPGAAADFQNARIWCDRSIEQPREFAAFCTCPQGLQTVLGPISRKWRMVIELPDGFGAGHPARANWESRHSRNGARRSPAHIQLPSSAPWQYGIGQKGPESAACQKME